MKLSTRIVKLFDKTHQIFLRSEGHSDNLCYEQVIVDEDYSFSAKNGQPWTQGISLDRYYDHLIANGKTPLILDMGANIGMSALYFASKYPQAKIYAVEPDHENFQMLIMNTPGLSIEYFQAAIEASEGISFLSDPGLSDWGFRVGGDSGTKVEVLEMSKLVEGAIAADLVPLLCKIYIEGGGRGKELFSCNTSWFKLFPAVILELHDWTLLFQNSSRGFLDTISDSGYEIMHKGENGFFFDPQLQYINPALMMQFNRKLAI